MGRARWTQSCDREGTEDRKSSFLEFRVPFREAEGCEFPREAQQSTQSEKVPQRFFSGQKYALDCTVPTSNSKTQISGSSSGSCGHYGGRMTNYPGLPSTFPF